MVLSPVQHWMGTLRVNDAEIEARRRKNLQIQLDYCRRMVENKVREVRRSAALIGRWQKKCTYFERELATTAAQKRVERERLLEARRKRRAVRKITL